MKELIDFFFSLVLKIKYLDSFSHTMPCALSRQFVNGPVQSFGQSVREEAVLSKQSLHGWLKALSLHADLLQNDNKKDI